MAGRARRYRRAEDDRRKRADPRMVCAVAPRRRRDMASTLCVRGRARSARGTAPLRATAGRGQSKDVRGFSWDGSEQSPEDADIRRARRDNRGPWADDRRTRADGCGLRYRQGAPGQAEGGY